MSRTGTVCLILIVSANVLGVVAALLAPVTGDGLGDALEAHFWFAVFCSLGLLISVGFVGAVIVRWTRTSRRERAVAVGSFFMPIISYLVLIGCGAIR